MSSFPPAPAPARSPSLPFPNATAPSPSTPIQPPPTSLPPLFSSPPPPPSSPAPAPSPTLSSHNATSPPPSSPSKPPPLNSPAPAPSPSQSPIQGGGVALPPPPPSTRFKFRPPYRPPTYPPPPGASGSSSAKGVSMGIIVVGTMVGVILIVMTLVLVVLCFRKRKNNEDTPPSPPPPPPKGRLYNPPPRKLNPKFHPPKPWNPSPPKPQFTGINVDYFSTSSENLYSPMAPAIPASFSGGNLTILELAASTANFSAENLLGEGGFGYGHKGVLPNGRRIAVKRLKLGSRQGEREFQAEVETISRAHHRNLVSLLGYCMTGAERLLVYEFVPNNKLEFHLHGKEQPVIKWATRMKIAIGSAKGLAYLHEDCNPTIIHRDIKASNILLDFKFEAKVADFGLAKFFSDTNHDITHVYTRVVGTFGYLAPEYAASGRASDKKDVFSFGVMLLELITGRKPLSTTDCLLSWARPLLKQAMEGRNFDALVDPQLQKDYNSEEMAAMVACAAACVRNSEWRRPRMSQIIRTLEGDVSLSDLDEGIKPGHSTIYDVRGTPYLD